MKIKVCGLMFKDDIEEIIKYADYIGFIFYDKSPRYAAKILEADFIRNLPCNISKVGVFVNEKYDRIIEIAEKFKLSHIQLHGDEPPTFCEKLRAENLKVIKAFGINHNFDFKILDDYLETTDFFLFDTKSKARGGTGKRFDWAILNNYKTDKSFFLSGGLSIRHAEEIKVLQYHNLHAIDINSKFEIFPGKKNIFLIQYFVEKLKNNEKTIDKKRILR